MKKLDLVKIFLVLALLAIIINLIFYEYIINAEGWIISILFVSVYLFFTNKKLKGRTAFLFIGMWALVEIITRFLELYRVFPNYDILSHVLAFGAITSALVLIYNKKFNFIFLFVLVVSILFEIGEELQELIIPQPVWLYDCLFCWDGVIDVGINLLTAALVYFIIKKLRK